MAKGDEAVARAGYMPRCAAACAPTDDVLAMVHAKGGRQYGVVGDGRGAEALRIDIVTGHDRSHKGPGALWAIGRRMRTCMRDVRRIQR